MEGSTISFLAIIGALVIGTVLSSLIHGDSKEERSGYKKKPEYREIAMGIKTRNKNIRPIEITRDRSGMAVTPIYESWGNVVYIAEEIVIEEGESLKIQKPCIVKKR